MHAVMSAAVARSVPMPVAGRLPGAPSVADAVALAISSPDAIALATGARCSIVTHAVIVFVCITGAICSA